MHARDYYPNHNTAGHVKIVSGVSYENHADVSAGAIDIISVDEIRRLPRLVDDHANLSLWGEAADDQIATVINEVIPLSELKMTADLA